MAFGNLDKRMYRDVRELHDQLWNPRWKGDAQALRVRLAAEAKALDAFLGAGGRLARPAAKLAKASGEGAGESLFELLYHAYHLTAATEHIRKGDSKGAGEHVAWAVEGMSIGVAVAAGRFDLVDRWEHGKADFETYAGRLADVLQAKGVSRAGDFKRVLVAARTFAKQRDSIEARDLAARAAIADAAWLAVTSVSIRRVLGYDVMNQSSPGSLT